VEQAFATRPGAALTQSVNARTPDVAAMIEAVEAFLRTHRPAADPSGELLQEIVAEMLVAPPGITVKEIARRHGMSTRALQRLFRSHVGLGPKWVLRRYRLQEAAERIAAGEAEDYASLALDLGYFDQAHFNRDFRSMVGRSPSEYAHACADGPVRS
jgi:AraC-like DNA-binding protein